LPACNRHPQTPEAAAGSRNSAGRTATADSGGTMITQIVPTFFYDSYINLRVHGEIKLEPERFEVAQVAIRNSDA
jgi:hypothetical protein